MTHRLPLSRHTTIETYLYSGQFEKREVLFDEDSIEVTNLHRIGLLDFDATALRGQRLLSARVTLKALTPDVPLEMAVTSISDDWDPRFANNYVRKEATPWAGDLWTTDVIMRNGNSVYARVPTAFDPANQLVSFDLPLTVLYRMIYGQSFGFALIDCKSRSYAPMDKKTLWCGGAVHKRFGTSASCGFLPVLEVESEPLEALATPTSAVAFGAESVEEPEYFDRASAALCWDLPEEEFAAPYLFYKLYVAEGACDDVASMRLAAPWQTPNYVCGCGEATVKLSFLKPDTDYTFALVVSNGVADSEPVWTTVRTRPARTPLAVGEVRPWQSPDTDTAEAAGFRVGVASEFDAPAPDAPMGKTFAKPKALAAPGERMGFLAVVENLGDAPASFTAVVAKSDFPAEAVSVRRAWYLQTKEERWVPEVAVPLKDGGAFDIPAADNAIEGQRCQALYVDVAIPADAPAGNGGFTLAITDGRETVEIPFAFTVAALQRETPDFKVELNGYVALSRCAGCEPGDPDWDQAEEEYYREAARNGMEVNILPYFHTGIVQDGFAPVVEMRDGLPTVVDWGPWDRHFDKYFDGSYRKGTGLAPAPISHIYLPFHENWPMPIREYDQVKVERTVDDYPENINERKLKAPPIAQQFRPGYREGIKAILKEFIRHVDEKGYKDVEFQYFLNNKHFYKQRGFVDRCKSRRTLEFWLCEPTCGNDGQGTSWWLLDEPNFMDDWDAIRYYGSILREARAETGSGENVKFRVDISCFNHMFDSLDGLLDVGVVASMFYNPREASMRERQKTLGEKHWMYGSWNAIGKDNLGTALWFLDAYLRGAQGIIPWYNYGLDWNYESADTCAALYPGRRFGSAAPLPSLRLKAGRKALEVIGYLETLRRRKGLSGLQLRTYVADVFRALGLEFDGTTIRETAVDAGTVHYQAADASVLEALKADVVARLS